MKTFKTIVGCGLTAALCVFALAAQAAEKSVKWSLPGDWESGAECGGMVRGLGEVGAPDLPAFRYTVTMPKGAKLTGVTFEVAWKEVEGVPSPVAEPVTSGQKLVYPEPGPQFNEVYPASAAYALEAMISGNKILQPIVITPYKWDGTTKTLYRATKLDVTITYTEPRTLKLTTSSVDETEGEVLILSPHDFVSLWQGYAAFRKSTDAGKNFTFKVVDTSTIYNDSTYMTRTGDYALALHHYIESQFYSAPKCDKQYVILGASPAKTATFNPNTMIPKRDFFGDSGTSTHDYNQAGDMYYGCMERLKNGQIDPTVEVWDYGNDGVYWAAQNTSPYNFDPNDCVDWTMEIAVTRVPLLERSVEKLGDKTIEKTAAQMMDAFTNRIAWAESAAFETADRGKSYVGGNENEGNDKGGKDERYTGERTFFDGITNIFDPSRNGKITSDEWGPRDRAYNIMGKVQPQRDAKIIANNIHNTDIAGAYAGRGDLATFYSHGDWREYGNLSASRAYQGGGFYAVYATSFSCMSGKYDTNGDGAGITNALCFGEAPIVAPVTQDGALVTLTSARDGWSGGFGTLSMYFDELFLKALYGLADGVPMNAAQAGKYAHNTYAAQAGKGTTSAHGSVLGHAILCGDPLIKVFMMPNRTELTGYSRNLSVSTASSKTFNIADDVAAARAAFSDAGNQTLTLQGAGKFRTTDTLTVTNVANLVWSVAGGAGRNGIAFVGQAGRLTLPGNAVRYFGPKLTNVGEISVTGGNVTLDFDTTACSFDELKFVSQDDTTANPNVLRTRKEGFIPAAQTIPVVNSALKLQTINIGGSNATLTDTPLFYVTNGVLTVESNPYWGTEYFVRPTYLSDAKILGEYVDFGLGRPDSNGYDLYVDGTSEIGGSTPIKVTGELRLHLEDAATTLTLTNALANGHNGAAGSVVVSGAGKVVLATSPTLTGGMTIEDGVALELPKIPLTSGGTITLESGAKLLLPEPSSSGIYNVYSGDAKIVLESGAKVCKASAPDTEIKGHFNGGSFIPDDAVIYWKVTSGTWQNSASVTTCWTNSNGTAVGFTNGQSVFFGPVASSVTVNSSGVTADYVEVNAPGKTYTFNSSSITPNLLSIMSDVTFNAPITDAKCVSVSGGTTTMGADAKSTIKLLEVGDGATLSMAEQGSLKGVTGRTVKALKFSFSESRSAGQLTAIQELRLFNGSGRFRFPVNTIIRDSNNEEIKIIGDSGEGHTYEWIKSNHSKENESLKALIDGIVEGTNKWWPDGQSMPVSFEIVFPTAQNAITGYNLRTADHAPRNPKSWTVSVSDDGVSYTPERSQSGVDFSSTGSWMSGDGSAKAYDLMTDQRGTLHVKQGGTLVSLGNAYVDVTLDEGSVLKIVGGAHSLFRPTTASYCNLNLPANGGVYVSAQGLSSSTGNEVLSGYSLTDADKAKFTPADNVTLYLDGGTLKANVDSTRCGPFKTTLTAATGATPSWTTLAWTDRYGASITWDSSLQYSASATATIQVGSLPENGATLDINYTPTLATMKLVGGSTEPLTLRWTAASVATIDLSEYAGRVILQPNGNIASTVTIIAGADTVLDAMCEASFTIGVDKQLTVWASGLKQTQITNNGTIVFDGGSEASPIDIFDNGPDNNTGFGTVKLTAGTVVRNKVNNNRIHTVTGAGTTSIYKVYRGSGFGTTTGTQFRNLTFVVAESGSTACWIEREGSFDATVDVRVDGGSYYLHGYSPTIGSLRGGGSVTRQNSQTLTITPTANADYSGASSVAFTIAASEFTQTLSGNYTGALTVDAGGKVALGASAQPSSIVNSGMVTVAGDQLTCALTLNSGATVNVTTPGEPTADAYAITSGTFADNGGTVLLNGNELGSQWHIENGRIVRTQAVQYGPLMSERWHQHNPFNWFAAYVGGNYTPCGCVAMGVGQMFHYYRWPVRTDTVTEAATTYQTGGVVTPFPLAVDGKNPFLWDEMRDYASACTLTGQYEAARMILWCDALAKMCFQPGGSNTALYYVPESVSYWYEKGEELLPSAGDHRERLKTELAAGRPIQTTIDGHQVVIDGWRSSDNKFHVNWGQEDSDPGKTTWFDVTQSTLGSWSVSSFWVGIAPRKMAQIQTLPKLGSSTVTLAWDVPAVHTNSITGFTVKDYTCADAVTNYSIPGTNELSYTRADYYPIPGVYGATENATFSCTVHSSNTKALIAEVQVRYDGGSWQTFATPTLSTEESYWEEKTGKWIDKSIATNILLNLSAKAGEAAEFRIKTTRTGNSFAAEHTGPYLRLYNCAWTNVHASVAAVAHAAGAAARSLEISGLAAGSYHSFTVTPTVEGAVESEPMGMRVAAASQAVPALPEILRVETMGSPITDGFVRAVKPGAMVFFVKGSETVTGVRAAISHPGLVAANLVRVKPISQGNWYAIEIDASEQIAVNSRMILTIEATDAYENRAVKDMMLIVSNTIEDDNDGQLMSALDQENAVIVPPDVTNHLESTFDQPLVGAGTVIFNNTLPEGTTLIQSLQNSFAWHGTVRMVDCPAVQYPQMYKNENSFLVEEKSPTPPAPEPEILQNAYLWLDASAATTITKSGEQVTNWASRNSGGKAASTYTATSWQTKTTRVNQGPTVTDGALAGKNVVDFGNCGSNRDLKFDQTSSVRAVFMVADIDDNGNAFILADSSSYHFHRDGSKYFNSGYASANLRNGQIRRDREVKASSDNIGTGYGLITLIPTAGVTASRICYDRDVEDARDGGKRVAELIIFTTEITNAQRDEIETYLMNKWFPSYTATATKDCTWSELWGGSLPPAGADVKIINGGADGVTTVTIPSGTSVGKLTIESTASKELKFAGFENLTATAFEFGNAPGGVGFDATAGLTVGDPLKSYIRDANVKVVFHGSGENGATLAYNLNESKTVQGHWVFEGGKHALTYGNSKSGAPAFGTHATADNPTVLVKNGTMLDFTGKDLSCWSGSVDINGIIAVENGGKINFINSGTGTIYYRQRLTINPGGEICIKTTQGDGSGNDLFRLQGGCVENKEQIYVPASTAGSPEAKITAGNGGSHDGIRLHTDATKGFGVFVGENSTLSIANRITSADANAPIGKYGAGTLKLNGTMSGFTSTFTVSAGTLTVPAGSLACPLTLSASGATVNITGETGLDEYVITSGTFMLGSGTVLLNGAALSGYEVDGNKIVKKSGPEPTGAIHATVESAVNWSAIEWYNASEQKIGTITDFSEVTSAALTIGNAGVVTIDNWSTISGLAAKLTIGGAGKIAYTTSGTTTAYPTWNWKTGDDAWTGTYALSGYDGEAQNWNPTTYFNGTASKFEFGGTVKTKGWFWQSSSANNMFGELVLTGTLNFTDGHTHPKDDNDPILHYCFTKLSGGGNITINTSSSATTALRFSDVSAYTGALSVDSTNGSGNGYRVFLGDGTLAASGNNPTRVAIHVTGNATLGTATYTAKNGIIVHNPASVGGTATLASATTFGDGAEIDNRSGVLTATGTLTFGATTKVRVATVPAGDVKIINKSGTTAGDIDTTVSVYVGSSETPETHEYKLAYKTDGVYLIPGESPYAKFDYGIVYSWLTTGSSVVCMSSGDSSYQVFDIVGGTNKTDTTYHGNTTFGGQAFWKQFAYATGIDTTYAAPGEILRLAQGSYLTSIGATWGPLTFGGIIAEAGDTGYTFVNKSDGNRSNLLGDPSNTTPTFFDIGANVTFNRTGKLYLAGTLTFDIASGKAFNLNSAKTDQDLALFATVEAAGSGAFGTTTPGGTLIMKGEGTLQVNNLKALGSTLDYRNLPYNRANAYISGTLTINDATVIKLPEGLAENTPFKMATTLSGATSGERTIWIGDTQVTKNVTFENGTISYSTTVEYKYLGWNGSAWTNAQGVVTAVDGTCILNAKDGDVITFSSAVSPHAFNMPQTGTVTINDQQNLSVSTIAIPSAATLVIKANNTFSPALTGSGTLSVDPGQVKFNGPTKLPGLSGFSGTLQMVRGRLQDYTSTSLLPSAVTVEILDGAQFFFGSAVTMGNTFIFRGNGWTGESNVWIYGPARFGADVTLSGAVTFDRDNAAPQILIASGKTLTLSGAVSAPHGFTTAGSDGTIKLTTVADDTIAGAVTLNTGDLWYGTGKNSGGTAGTSYKCGDTIIVKTGRTFNLHPWTTTQVDDSESNKVILASAIDMQGGTFHVEDGSYVFGGDFNVVSNSTLSFKWAKGRVIKSLKGDLDVTLTVNSANDDKSVSMNYFKGGDFAGTLKLTGSGTGAYLIPYGTALSKATVSPESGWDICLTQNATIGMLNGGQSVFGDGTASPVLTLKGGIYSGAFKDTSSGVAAGTPLSLAIDGEVALSGDTTHSGTTTISDTGVLAMAATTQRTLKALAFELGGVLIVNTNDTQAAVAVTDALDLQNATIRLGNTLPAEGGTIKLISSTGGISNYDNALEGRGDWTLQLDGTTLTATKAKATYVTPGEGGVVTNAGNSADSLDISMTLAKKATKGTKKEVTDESTPTQITEALNQDGANGYKVWENAVLGLSSTNANEMLVITPIQTSNENKVTLKVPEVHVDATTGADVTFCFWSKTTDSDWTEVQGGVVESGEEKALDLPTSGVKYYQLRTTIKAGQVTPVPTVIPSANIVAAGMPLTTGTGSTKTCASLGTKTLDEVTSSLTIELAGSGVYEGQEYHLEVTEPANADANHFAILAKADANKTVTFIFGKNVKAGSTCKLTMYSAQGNGNVVVKTAGFEGVEAIDKNVIVSTRVGWTPYDDGIATVPYSTMPQQFRIPAIASDGKGEVIACYDCRYGESDLGTLWKGVYSGIDIAENYSSDAGKTFDKVHLGVNVPNFRDHNGNWIGGPSSAGDSSYINKTNDLGDVCLLFDPAGDSGKGLYWMMGITGGGLVSAGTDSCNNDVVLYTRKPGKDSKWTEWDNGGSGDHWAKRSVKQQILTSLGKTSGTINKGFLEGPGHGIVTTKANGSIPAGTLVFPIQCFFSDGTHAGAAYSTDGGKTWQATALTDTNSAPQENCIMELDDGSWYMCTKCQDAGYYRCYRYNQSANSWTKTENGAPCPGACEGSCLRLGVDSDGKGRYAICHARDKRANIVVYFGVDNSSADIGITWDWNNYVTIHKENTGVGYSSMCMVDDTTLGILYESQYEGSTDGGSGPKSRMYFTRIDVSDKVVPPAK